MTEYCPLSAIMTSNRPDDLPVANVKGSEQVFGDFRRDIVSTIHKIQARKAKKVVLATQDAYYYCVGFLAALHAGCRIIIPPNSQPGTLENYVTLQCPLLGDGGPETHRNILSIGGQIRADFDFQVLDPEKCHLDFYTSGSTGTPKRVGKLLSQIENELIVLDRTWGRDLDGAAALGTVTHQHIYGLYFKALWPLSAGRPFYGQTFEIWEDMLAMAPPASCLVSSPAHLTRIPGFTPLTADRQPRMILSAGGPLPFEAAQKANEILGVVPTEIYGSTETGGVAHRQQTAPSTPFAPLDGMETRIDDSGLLSVRSNYTDNGDWAITNDMANRFEDGSFLLSGRSDQFVKIEGKRISLAEIEKFLIRSGLVVDAAVFPLTQTRETLAAVVELTDQGWQKHEELGPFRLNRHLRQILGENLEPAAMPKRWRFVRAMPTNSQGKRMKSELQSLFDK